MDLERRAPTIAKQLEAMSGRKASHAAVVAFIGVEEAFLKAAFAAIRTEFGSLDAYFERALGVTHDRRARIEARLSA